jgi:mitochondrial fission protein ELM1
MIHNLTVWALADDRAGHANQALGVAAALAREFQVKALGYNQMSVLPNFMLGAGLRHLTRQARAHITPPWPDIVIGAGRRTVPVARAIKRLGEGRPFLIQCMWPETGADQFDLIAVPAHDKRSQRANVIQTVGAPHRMTRDRLQSAAKSWGVRIGGLPKPRLAVLVGGSTRGYRFDAAAAHALAERVAQLHAALGGSLLVTTSRRTTPEARNALYRTLSPAHQFDWGDEEQDNPYDAYLALSDAVIVTGDSTAMCTEACATGRPVYIDAPKSATSAKHKALHARLQELGLAQSLDEALAAGEIEPRSYQPLDDAALVASEAERRYTERAAAAS